MATPEFDQQREIRLSDADREAAANRLYQALGEGRISISELEERLDVVYAARYAADLSAPFADLPGPDIASPLSPVVATPSGPPVVLRAAMSGLKRNGSWQVPPRLRVRAGMGSVVLDFCDADNPHPVVEIELLVGAGSARLLVPEGATANVDDVVATYGSVVSKVPSLRRIGSPHFVVHGYASLGSIRIRHRYRFAGHWF